MEESEVEVAEVEENATFLAEVIFNAPVVIKMSTLKVISFKRK